jgi:hypothetical protein
VVGRKNFSQLAVIVAFVAAASTVVLVDDGTVVATVVVGSGLVVAVVLVAGAAADVAGCDDAEVDDVPLVVRLPQETHRSRLPTIAAVAM